jgi:uncharacterized protein YjiS (DUF1127 family)
MTTALAIPASALPVDGSSRGSGTLGGSGLFSEWRLRRRYRADLRRLLSLGPHLVADIGLNPIEAAWEAAKPVWKA